MSVEIQCDECGRQIQEGDYICCHRCRKDDYQHTLTLIDELMDASPNTPEGDELELLVTLVALYEEKHYPIAMPNPVEAIKFRMEQRGT